MLVFLLGIYGLCIQNLPGLLLIVYLVDVWSVNLDRNSILLLS
jgi:hypothetical protein